MGVQKLEGNFVQCFGMKDSKGNPFYSCATNVFSPKDLKRSKVQVFTSSLVNDRDADVQQVLCTNETILHATFFQNKENCLENSRFYCSLPTKYGRRD